MSDDTIAAALGVSPLVTIKENLPVVKEEALPVPVTANAPSEQDVDEDFAFARFAMRDAILSAQESLKEMQKVSKISEHPRAYEVTGNLIKTIVEASEKLMDLNKKKKDMAPKKAEELPPTNITNNNLILSTAEMLDQLRGRR